MSGDETPRMVDHGVLHTPLCDVLGVRYPIVQTGMGWVATPELVAATANAGGFGFLAGATLTPRELEPAILRVKELTDKPFGVNFLMEQPNAAQVVQAVLDHGIRAVGYHRSPNPAYIARFKAGGVVCMPTAGALRHATKAVELGADVLIVQGGEGGGHTGSVPTSLLVPQIVDAVDVPVVAAGGLRDGRGLVAALAFGAVGVAMGTRFLMTAESPVSPAAMQRYLAAGVDDTVVTREIDGLPQRLVANEFVRQLQQTNPIRRFALAVRSALAYRRMSEASLPQLLRAGLSLRRSEKLTRTQLLMAANAAVLVRKGIIQGDAANGILPTGQVAGLIDDLPTTGELIDRIMTEAAATLTAMTS